MEFRKHSKTYQESNCFEFYILLIEKRGDVMYGLGRKDWERESRGNFKMAGFRKAHVCMKELILY